MLRRDWPGEMVCQMAPALSAYITAPDKRVQGWKNGALQLTKPAAGWLKPLAGSVALLCSLCLG